MSCISPPNSPKDRFTVHLRAPLQLSFPRAWWHLALAGPEATFSAVAFSGGPPMRRLMLLSTVALAAHAVAARAQNPTPAPAPAPAPAPPAPPPGLNPSNDAGPWAA